MGAADKLKAPLSAAGRLVTRRSGRGGGVVLAYHDVVAGAEVDGPWSVTADQLSTHLRVVRRLGFTFVTLADLTRRTLAGESVDGLAAIAFDDALAGVARNALPILHEQGVPSTLMTVSTAWGNQPAWWPGSDRTMTRAELAEAVGHGVDLAAHTRTHTSLTALASGPAGALRDEVEGCRDELEDLTGAPVKLFAYPFGHHDPAVREAVETAGYDAAFTFLNGRVGSGLDRHRLPRLTMGAHQSAARLAYHLARPAHSWPDHQVDRVDGGENPAD
ncbi:polysaccharide deacetylase family protein [Nocardioides sp.]|uniref:polysaccharide deacetylase family protein n=1 Tax=Nocardioides sp. TaxID=35761 RepID=UPI002B277C74|nr:polysaccharide deacetylase family protein [Nocardioides sp.]